MLEVRRTAEQVSIPLTVGSTHRCRRRSLLRAGADKVAVNTAAIACPTCWRTVRLQCIVLSVDARTKFRWGSAPTPSGWEVTTHGGRRGTGGSPCRRPVAPTSVGRSCSTDGRRQHRRIRPGVRRAASRCRYRQRGRRCWSTASWAAGAAVLAASVFTLSDDRSEGGP